MTRILKMEDTFYCKSGYRTYSKFRIKNIKTNHRCDRAKHCPYAKSETCAIMIYYVSETSKSTDDVCLKGAMENMYFDEERQEPVKFIEHLNEPTEEYLEKEREKRKALDNIISEVKAHITDSNFNALYNLSIEHDADLRMTPVRSPLGRLDIPIPSPRYNPNPYPAQYSTHHSRWSYNAQTRQATLHR